MNELANVLIHLKRVRLSSVAPHLEHRLASLRSEMKVRGTPGYQLDRASKLLERAKEQREKTENSITVLEEKLLGSKTKWQRKPLLRPRSSRYRKILPKTWPRQAMATPRRRHSKSRSELWLRVFQPSCPTSKA